MTTNEDSPLKKPAWLMSRNMWTLLALAVVVTAQDSKSGGWPEGRYGLPMSESGCPVTDGFKWSTGRRTQQTEMGSMGSTPNHLANIHSYETDKVTQSFCMKLNKVGSDQYKWEPGEYCVYKVAGAHCPGGFREGWIYWDDAAPWFGDSQQGLAGTVPHGEYDRNTKIYYCCRRDGNAKKEISLPRESPFYLLRLSSDCQEVKGMEVKQEWVYWKDEKTVNMNKEGGLYPAVARSFDLNEYTRLYYCYYTKKPTSDSAKKAMLAIYIIAGLVGGSIILMAIICILQRIFIRNPKDDSDDEDEAHNASNIRRERMMNTQASPERSPIYRPPPLDEPPEYNISPIRKKSPIPAEGAAVVSTGPPLEGATGGPRDEEQPMLAAERQPDMSALPLSPEYTPRPESKPPSYEEVLRSDGKIV